MKGIIFFLLLTFSASAQLLPDLHLDVQNKSFSAGDTVTADFYVTGFDSISAYQFAIQFDSLEIEFLDVATDSSALGLSPDDFGLWTLNKARIPTVWSNPWSSTLPPNSYLFSIRFIAQVNGDLFGSLRLEPKPSTGFYLWPLYYDFYLQPGHVALSWYDVATSTESPVSAATIQAIPNPCPLYTTISFDATGETDYACHVTDMQVRNIRSITGTTSYGRNELPITLPAPGMYLVAIKTKCATFVEKIVAQ